MSADERGASPIALLTGANRGIGFEVCRQLARGRVRVVLGTRDPEKTELAAKELSGEGLDVLYTPLKSPKTRALVGSLPGSRKR